MVNEWSKPYQHEITSLISPKTFKDRSNLYEWGVHSLVATL